MTSEQKAYYTACFNLTDWGDEISYCTQMAPTDYVRLRFGLTEQEMAGKLEEQVLMELPDSAKAELMEMVARHHPDAFTAAVASATYEYDYED